MAFSDVTSPVLREFLGITVKNSKKEYAQLDFDDENNQLDEDSIDSQRGINESDGGVYSKEDGIM